MLGSQQGRMVCIGERGGWKDVQTQAPVALLALMLREDTFGPSLEILASSSQDDSLP